MGLFELSVILAYGEIPSICEVHILDGPGRSCPGRHSPQRVRVERLKCSIFCDASGKYAVFECMGGIWENISTFDLPPTQAPPIISGIRFPKPSIGSGNTGVFGGVGIISGFIWQRKYRGFRVRPIA